MAGAESVIVSFRRMGPAFHAGVMVPGRIVLDLAMAGVVISLVSIVLFFVFGAGASLLTIAAAARRARRSSHRLLCEQLSNGCAVAELAEIDEALDQVLAEEYRGLPASPAG